MAKDDIGGVWRTVGGRRIFIKDGQDLASAMKESGKFKNTKIKQNGKDYKQIEKQLLEDYSKVDTEDLEEYYKIFKEQGKEKFAERIKKELDKRNYENYVNETLNNDEYLKANRPNEYWQKQMKESNVKTFADEIKEQDKISNYYEEQERQALRSKDMSYGYSKKALENISNKELDDYINRQEELVNEYTNKVNQDLTYDQRKIRNRQDTVWDKGMKAKYEQQLKNAQEEKTRREEYVNKYFSKENNYSGYETYLRDRYGTENEDIVSAGYKNKKDLYQEYKNEVIRNINNKRMEKGTTSLNQAYKKAFEEYKKLHPNTKLNLQKFIEMSEE